VKISILRGFVLHERGNRNNLVLYRWCGPILTASEEIELIAKVQAGDRDTKAQAGGRDAGWLLLRSFHRKIRQLAGKHVPRSHYRSQLFDDLIAEGMLALWEAALSFDLNSGFRFWSFALKSVSGAISDAAKEWRKQGIGGESRTDRWLLHHYNAETGELVAASKKLGKTFHSFQEAREAIESLAKRYRFETYADSLEHPDHFNIGSDQNRGDSVRNTEPAESIRGLYSCSDPHQLAPHLLVHGRISSIIEDLARGRRVKMERFHQVRRYFDQDQRKKWIKKMSHSLNTAPLPLSRPRHWRKPSGKQRRRNYAHNRTSAGARWRRT
jgi:hypothetical protein